MKGVTINLSLPQRLLKKVEREADREERSRSELIRVALQSYLERKEAWDKLRDYGRRQAKKKGLKPSDVEKVIAEVRWS